MGFTGTGFSATWSSDDDSALSSLSQTDVMGGDSSQPQGRDGTPETGSGGREQGSGGGASSAYISSDASFMTSAGDSGVDSSQGKAAPERKKVATKYGMTKKCPLCDEPFPVAKLAAHEKEYVGLHHGPP